MNLNVPENDRYNFFGQLLKPRTVYGILDPSYLNDPSRSIKPYYGYYAGISGDNEVLYIYPWMPRHYQYSQYNGGIETVKAGWVPAGWAREPLQWPTDTKLLFLPLTKFAKNFPEVVRPEGFQTPPQIMEQAVENTVRRKAPAIRAYMAARLPTSGGRKHSRKAKKSQRKRTHRRR